MKENKPCAKCFCVERWGSANCGCLCHAPKMSLTPHKMPLPQNSPINTPFIAVEEVCKECDMKKGYHTGYHKSATPLKQEEVNFLQVPNTCCGKCGMKEMHNKEHDCTPPAETWEEEFEEIFNGGLEMTLRNVENFIQQEKDKSYSEGWRDAREEYTPKDFCNDCVLVLLEQKKTK